MRSCFAYCLCRSNNDIALAQQRREIEVWADSVGLKIDKLFSDEPIFLERIKETRLQRAVLALMERYEGMVDPPPLLVADRSRLLRPDLDLDLGAELEARGVLVLAVGDPVPRPKTEQQRRPAPFAGLSVAERLLRGREEGARAGKHQSGPAPYGYMRDYSERNAKGVRLQIHPEEAAVVRTIFKEYLRRRSMKRLIEFLDAQGLSTRRHKQWSRAGVSWILKNETYLGRVHFGNIRAKGQHPAIISPIIFNKVNALIRANNKRGGKRRDGE